MRKIALFALSVGILASCSKEDQVSKPIFKKSAYTYSETWQPSSSDIDAEIETFISDVEGSVVSDMPVQEALFFLEASVNKNRAYSPNL